MSITAVLDWFDLPVDREKEAALGPLAEAMAAVVFGPFENPLFLRQHHEAVPGRSDETAVVSVDVARVQDALRSWWKDARWATYGEQCETFLGLLSREVSGSRVNIQPPAAQERVETLLDHFHRGLPWIIPHEGAAFLRLDEGGGRWSALIVRLREGFLEDAWTTQGHSSGRLEADHRAFCQELSKRRLDVKLGVSADVPWSVEMSKALPFADLLVEGLKKRRVLVKPASRRLTMALGALKMTCGWVGFKGR